jgi:hypothetical protein
LPLGLPLQLLYYFAHPPAPSFLGIYRYPGLRIFVYSGSLCSVNFGINKSLIWALKSVEAMVNAGSFGEERCSNAREGNHHLFLIVLLLPFLPPVDSCRTTELEMPLPRAASPRLLLYPMTTPEVQSINDMRDRRETSEWRI